jgi:uncharacterized RDD family membrane protein YckC
MTDEQRLLAVLAALYLLECVRWLPLSVRCIVSLTGWGGWTPGKLVMGIRVCRSSLGKPGLFRGLVRELLLMVDGFFNFLVGVLLIAFTVKWQRVGDLAADTIVVDARSLAAAREELARR